MNDKRFVRMAGLCLIVALMVGTAAVIGVFFRGEGTPTTIVSPRGEEYAMISAGVYRYNSQRMVSEGAGWDIFTLFFAVPAMLAVLFGLSRGFLRARLFALGLLVYFFYQYLCYALGWAFGPLFPLFIVIFAASLAGALWIASTIDVARLPAQLSKHFPRRGMAILCAFMAVVLLAMWGQRIAAGLRGDLETAMLLGQTTMVVQVLDLGLLVPLSLFTALAAWRGWPVGYLLSSVFVIKAVAMAAAICAMLLSAWATEGTLEVVPLLIFGTAAVAASWLGVRMYRR